MKKSLSLLLAVALVFSMFGSLAYAADENLTTEQKYQIQANLGIYSGINGEPALDQPMTRAQFARVAALIRGLDGIGNPDTRVVTEKPFPDVEVDAWYAEEVEAVKEAGLMQGDGTNFNPDSNITVHELAVVYVGLLDLEPVEGAEVEGAADWAAGYIQALLDNGVDFPTNYTEPALRADLVDAAYVAAEEFGIVAPEKVSIVSAKPTGVQKVTVELDKAVDTEKATLTLKRGTLTIATKTVWAENGKSATLELEDTKIMEGEYSVTLGGLDDSEVNKAVATFTAENEKVTKLEFVAPSDTIAQAKKVRIQFQALNQYGEETSIAAGNFQVYASTPPTVSDPTVTRDANGNLYVVLDTDDSDQQNPVLIPNVSQISVNIVNTDSQISATKIFTVGNKPYVQKVELGEVVYSNSEGYLSKQGDKAVIELIQYDQYGHRITEDSNALFNASVNVLPYLQELEAYLDDDNNDDILDVVVELQKGDAKVTGDYTVSVFGGTTATTTISIKATKYAATVELEAPSVLAQGDFNKYINIIAYDKDGNRLSAQDIVDNYENGHIKFNASGNLEFGPKGDVTNAMLAKQNGQAAVVKTGEHKGKLHIAEVGTKGYANIFVNITPDSANGIMFNKNFTFNILDQRYPQSLKLKEENATKAVAGATSKVKIIAIDNYGEEFKKFNDHNDDPANPDIKIKAIRENTRSVTYDVYVSVVKKSGNVDLDGAPLGTVAFDDLSSVLDKEFTFNAGAANVGDVLEVKFSLRKIQVNVDNEGFVDSVEKVIDDSVSSITRRMEVINPKNKRLVYSIKKIDTLFDALDDKTYENAADHDSLTASKHSRKVEIEARDGGDKVALPDLVISVTSSNPDVVVTDSKNKILGNKAGTATINVIYEKAEGGNGTLSQTVEVKSDAIAVASFSGGKASATMTTDGVYAWQLMELKVKDNYNTEYKFDDGATAADSSIKTYDKHLGIRYAISDVQAAAGGSVEVINDSASGDFGKIDITGNVIGFTLTAIAPNGETRVTAVSVDPNLDPTDF